MTRKSRREIQRDVEQLSEGGSSDEVLSDAERGVTAPWVTYEPDGFGDVPEGASVYTPAEDG